MSVVDMTKQNEATEAAKDKEAVEGLLLTALGVGIMIYIAIAGGFVLAHLWSWFFVSLGLPQINYVQAAGIMTTTRFLASGGLARGANLRNFWISVFAGPWIVLVIGWGIRSFL